MPGTPNPAVIPPIDRPVPGDTGRGGAFSGRRSLARQYAILEAARGLLLEKGYAAVTMDDIAREARTSKQTIYRWWPGKGALYLELYERLVPAALFQRDTGSLAGDLRGLLEALFEIYSKTGIGRALAGLVGETTGDPALADAMRGAFAIRRRAGLEAVFARAAARGELRPGADTESAGEMIAGAIWLRLMLGPDEPDADFARRLAFLAEGALKP